MSHALVHILLQRELACGLHPVCSHAGQNMPGKGRKNRKTRKDRQDRGVKITDESFKINVSECKDVIDVRGRGQHK